MTWINEREYMPEGMDSHGDYPVLVISRHVNWGMIRDEIEAEAPNHPVFLASVGSPLHGMRFRSFELRHVGIADMGEEPFHMWINEAVRCRIFPVPIPTSTKTGVSGR